MRPPRCTLRTLLLLVAVAGICICYPVELWRRQDRYRRQADYHHTQWLKALWEELGEGDPPGSFEAEKRVSAIVARERHHSDLAGLYREAASRPWRPLPTLESRRRVSAGAAKASAPRSPGPC